MSLITPGRMSAALVLASAILHAAPVGAQSYPTQADQDHRPGRPRRCVRYRRPRICGKAQRIRKNGCGREPTGGGGTIGAEAAAKSLPDGYTLYMGFHATQSILPHLMPKLPYDAAKDFAPIIFLATAPNVLIVHPSVPAKTRARVDRLHQGQPRQAEFGTPGVGSSDPSGRRAVPPSARPRHRTRTLSRRSASQCRTWSPVTSK